MQKFGDITQYLQMILEEHGEKLMSHYDSAIRSLETV